MAILTEILALKHPSFTKCEKLRKCSDKKTKGREIKVTLMEEIWEEIHRCQKPNPISRIRMHRHICL